MSNTCDFLVIGGGVVGINVARELKKRNPSTQIILIEKEDECAAHASGRNSGVLHAGFYYTADSLKAKFTQQGNKRMTAYADEKKLPILKCGKLVVAKNAAELAQLDVLMQRGKANNVPLEKISEKEARKIEPRVKTHEAAIWSPTTSSVDPLQVTLAMKDDAILEGVEIRTGTRYVKREGDTVHTSNGTISAGYVVNSAGLYADKIAMDYGFSENYRILPFKGLYIYSNEHDGALKTNIYPVPDLRNPFLGVHFTLLVNGHFKIGPTAIPVFWRENYQGLDNFRLDEFVEIAFREASLMLFAGFDFRTLAMEEMHKQSKKWMVGLASVLLEDTKLENYTKWGRPGIRAQLMDIKKKKLEMDFVIQGDKKSLHILNAVSPGFTCSLPFSEYVCDKLNEFTK